MENGVVFNKKQIKLEILVFAIEIVNNQFGQYPLENVLKLYNYGLSKANLARVKLTTIKKYLKKLKEFKIITKCCTRKTTDCGFLVHYKLNYTTEQACAIIRLYIFHENKFF
uniref:plasmid maintenance protein n=1 Tax=Borreliella californiensis TaxID=373543 RepID=UPI003B211F66